VDGLFACIVHWQAMATSRQTLSLGVSLYVWNHLLDLPSHIFLPVIDAEVRYAVRHEYARTAIDVIARRTRLAFLNAQAAFDALPHIVDIMSEELGWSYSQRRKQIAAAAVFLGSMGLPPMLSSNLPEPTPKSWVEKIERSFWRTGSNVLGVFRWGDKVDDTDTFTPSRSKFEPGEVVALRDAFNARTKASEGLDKVAAEEIWGILKEIPGYADITKKELDYVLDEAGLREGTIDFDQFIEVWLSEYLLIPETNSLFRSVATSKRFPSRLLQRDTRVG
jgi:glycerol-3-phosphate dehydrogenase